MHLATCEVLSKGMPRRPRPAAWLESADATEADLCLCGCAANPFPSTAAAVGSLGETPSVLLSLLARERRLPDDEGKTGSPSDSTPSNRVSNAGSTDANTAGVYSVDASTRADSGLPRRDREHEQTSVTPHAVVSTRPGRARSRRNAPPTRKARHMPSA